MLFRSDIVAAMGLVEIERYDSDTQVKRKYICNYYTKFFEGNNVFEIAPQCTNEKESSYHLFPLRIKGISDSQRDTIIQKIFDKDVSVNVHFMPVPSTAFYKSLGYDMKNYPQALDNYSREITLPVYYDLTDENLKTICEAVLNSVNEVLK